MPERTRNRSQTTRLGFKGRMMMHFVLIGRCENSSALGPLTRLLLDPRSGETVREREREDSLDNAQLPTTWPELAKVDKRPTIQLLRSSGMSAPLVTCARQVAKPLSSTADDHLSWLTQGPPPFQLRLGGARLLTALGRHFPNPLLLIPNALRTATASNPS